MKLIYLIVVNVIFVVHFYGENNKYSFSKLTSNCSKEFKLNFYKTILFVNGQLASMSLNDIDKCMNNEQKNVLGVKNLESKDYPGYACECNDSKQLGCHKKEGWICNTITCFGGCDNNIKYSYDNKYIYGDELFRILPEDKAIDFIDGIVVRDAKVDSIEIKKDILKYLTEKKVIEIISILTGYDMILNRKINEMKECILKQNKDEILIKYNALFNDIKMDFKRYDTEMLEDLWYIYETLFNLTKDNKYFNNMESIYKVLSLREDKSKTNDYYFERFYKIKRGI